jgi:hypothetical protein
MIQDGRARQVLNPKRLLKLAARLLLVAVMVSAAAAQQTRPAPAPPRTLPGKTMDTVYLNHFFVTLDPDSCKAIESSPFLRDEFGPFEQRTTVRKDITYTGSYFYGEHTYFEFFEVGQGLGRTIGASGLAFGVEAVGASQRLRGQLERMFGVPASVTPVTRRVTDRDVNWFYMTTGPLTTLLQMWVMEYHYKFLQDWYGELEPTTRGITRAEILERYAAKIGEGDKRRQKLLEDVIELTIALPERDQVLLMKTCEAFGYRVVATPSGSRCEGPQVAFNLVAQPAAARGITAVKFSLRRAKQGEKVYRFGKTVLRFNDDRTAVWTFQ